MSGASECGSCRAKVFWAEFASGKSAMVNSAPDPAGQWTVTFRAGRAPLLVRHRPGPDLFAKPPHLYTVHFATCPDAGKWRSKGPAKKEPTA